MGGSTVVTLNCDGPKCSDKLVWNGQDPSTVPQAIHRWWTIVLSDKQDFIFCSKPCGLDWLRDNDTKRLSPDEREAIRQQTEKDEVNQKVDVLTPAVAFTEPDGQHLVEKA